MICWLAYHPYRGESKLSLNPARNAALKDGTAKVVHGRPHTYDTYGCRCAECIEAHRQRQVEQNESRAKRLAADPTVVKHGRRSTYSNWGCRCNKCTTVHASFCKADRERRLAAKIKAERAAKRAAKTAAKKA